MIKKPGIKTKQGLQISGIYILAATGIANILFPELEPQDVQDVVQWLADQDFSVKNVLNWLFDGGATGYILYRLRGGNDNT